MWTAVKLERIIIGFDGCEQEKRFFNLQNVTEREYIWIGRVSTITATFGSP